MILWSMYTLPSNKLADLFLSFLFNGHAVWTCLLVQSTLYVKCYRGKEMLQPCKITTQLLQLCRLLRIPLTGHETDWIASDQCCTPKFASFTWPLSIPIVSPEGMLMTIAASKWCGSSLSFAVFLVHAINLLTWSADTTGSCHDRKLHDRKLSRPVGCLESVDWTTTGLEYWTGMQEWPKLPFSWYDNFLESGYSLQSLH